MNGVSVINVGNVASECRKCREWREVVSVSTAARVASIHRNAKLAYLFFRATAFLKQNCVPSFLKCHEHGTAKSGTRTHLWKYDISWWHTVSCGQNMIIACDHRIKDDRMENSIMWSRLGTIWVSREGALGRYGPVPPPPPPPLLHRVAAKQHCKNFAIHKIWQIYFNFTKFPEILSKILWNTQN